MVDDQLLNKIAEAERTIQLRAERQLGVAAVIAASRILPPGTSLSYEVFAGVRDEYDQGVSEERGILIAKELANSTHQQRVWIDIAYRR